MLAPAFDRLAANLEEGSVDLGERDHGLERRRTTELAVANVQRIGLDLVLGGGDFLRHESER